MAHGRHVERTVLGDSWGFGEKGSFYVTPTQRPLSFASKYILSTASCSSLREVRDEIPDNEVFPAVVEASFHGNRRDDVIDR